MTDVWSQAAQRAGGASAPQQQAAEPGSSVMPDNGGFGGGVLFGGQGKRIPSLFNAGHMAGTVRGGVIVDIKDVHSHTHAREGNLPKYWEDGNTGKGISPVTYAVSKVTGKANRAVMDVHIVLDTEYRLTADECRLLERDPKDAETDDGQRVFVVSDAKLFAQAIEAYNQANAAAPLTKSLDLKGKRIEVRRMMNPREKGQSYPARILPA